MSHSMTIAEASIQLGQLIHGLAPGDEIVLTENDRPVAKIVTEAVKRSKKTREQAIAGIEEFRKRGPQLTREEILELVRESREERL